MASTVTLTIHDRAAATQLTVNDTAQSVVLTVTDAKGDPGQSAYQVWLGQGNTGPESAFFESLGASGLVLNRTAGMQLSALTAVYELDGVVYPLDHNDAAHIDILLGVTVRAAQAGAPVSVKRDGAINDDAWSWQPGRIYLGLAGTLTQTPPTQGFSVLLGNAVSATRIVLNLQDPIELE